MSVGSSKRRSVVSVKSQNFANVIKSVEDIYCHLYETLLMEFGLGIGFIGHLQTLTTSNYSVTANYDNLQITTTRTESSQSAISLLVVAL